MPKGFHLLIASQFVSALADNALLIVAIARLQELGMSGWWAPLLKFSFTLSYVLLAPWTGSLADAVPKARLMAWMNALKAVGAGLLLCGGNPLFAYGLVGLAAAAYAPAKYGIVTELVPSSKLVAANAWLEVSIVCAVLLGTVTGGLLVSPWLLTSSLSAQARDVFSALLATPTTLMLALMLVLLLYGVAALLNLGVPLTGRLYNIVWDGPVRMMARFRAGNLMLWRDRDGGLSLSVTTLFWGAGATLQFIVLQWAQQSLRLGLDRASFLQGAVAVGVVTGAALAGRWVKLGSAKRVLPLGVAMGLLTPLMSMVTSLGWALPLLIAIGACAGFFVVPMNAMLQDRGCRLMSAGRSIAVQGFNENASVLMMLAAYAAMLALNVPLDALIWGFGLGVATIMAVLITRERRLDRLPSAAALSTTEDAGVGPR
jgi:MFS family permease